jgi:hypothetical protein
MRLSSDHLQAFGTLAAALAALIALFVAIDQGRVMRAQQHASVMPILDAEVQLNDNGSTVELAVVLRNDGVGPAFVESLRILSDGVPMETWDQFNTVIFPEALRSADIFNGATVRGALGAGRQQPVVSFTWNRDDANEAAFLDLLERIVSTGSHIQIETCYCSVFDQCWIAEPGDTAQAGTVRSCPNAGDDVYAQLSATRPLASPGGEE